MTAEEAAAYGEHSLETREAAAELHRSRLPWAGRIKDGYVFMPEVNALKAAGQHREDDDEPGAVWLPEDGGREVLGSAGDTEC
jgi:hypothetical protein